VVGSIWQAVRRLHLCWRHVAPCGLGAGKLSVEDDGTVITGTAMRAASAWPCDRLPAAWSTAGSRATRNSISAWCVGLGAFLMALQFRPFPKPHVPAW